MRQLIYDSINEVSKKGKGDECTWNSIETAESYRKMKYKNSTTATIAWNQDNLLLYFFSEIQRPILDKICPDQKYIIGNYNLLKNTGDIMYDKIPHRDYQPRKG